MAETAELRRRLVAEGIASFFLFATVIGSGIMAEKLSGGNDAVAASVALYITAAY